MIPGEILASKGELELNKGRNPITIEVANTGDRPIQVGSHYHFFETNDALKFDRKRTKGMRLDIAAGTAVRFEPGQSRTVRLTPYLGGRESHGFQGRVGGKLGPIAKVGPSNEGPTRISRSAYVHMFGPTVGDKVRLADTDLFIEVEKDHTTYGEEVKFGGGKVIRDGMGQSQRTRAQGAVDTVITNALILDYWGVVKADIGLKGGLIVGDRQSRQSRYPTGRRYRHRSRHRGDRGRRQDHHGRWHRLPHPFHLSAAGRRRALQRHHHHDGRRHRSGARHARHHRDSRSLAHGPHAAGRRRLADESRLLRQGKYLQACRHQGADRGWRLRAEAA